MTVYTYTYLVGGTSKSVDLDTEKAQTLDEKLMTDESRSQVTWIDTNLIVSDPKYFTNLRSEALTDTLFVLHEYVTIDFINIMTSIVKEGGSKSTVIQLKSVGPSSASPSSSPTGVEEDSSLWSWRTKVSNLFNADVLNFFDTG